MIDRYGRFRRAAVAALLAMLAAVPLRADVRPVAGCALDDAGRAWMQAALDDWEMVSRDLLPLEARPLPWMVFIDTACAWHVGADAAGDAALAGTLAPAGAALRFGGAQVEVRGVAHTGSVRLPGGAEVPAAPLSFTAPYGDAGAAFFVIGMPPVWMRDARHAADPDLAWLIRAVLVHELTHTAQVATVYRRIDALAARVPDPGALNDDVIQARFDSVPGFRAAYQTERDLLFRAAAEPDPALRRTLAAQALAAMRERRTRYYAGADSVYAELEDVFLNMEGVANWASYQVALRHAGPAADPAEVLTRLRRGGRWWSQDEGLALFLVIDALVPGWRARVFAGEPVSVLTLLEEGTR